MTQTTTDREQIGHFAMYGIINLVMIVLLLYGNQFVPVDEDAYALVRVTVRILTFFFVGAFGLSWLYVFFDIICPGSLTARIMGGNVAAAIFGSAILFAGVALLFVK